MHRRLLSPSARERVASERRRRERERRAEEARQVLGARRGEAQEDAVAERARAHEERGAALDGARGDVREERARAMECRPERDRGGERVEPAEPRRELAAARRRERQAVREREARAQRDQLESYLTRYREATARDAANAAPPDARIVSRAIVPQLPSFPKKLPMIALATMATLVLATAAVFAREFLAASAAPAPARTPRASSRWPAGATRSTARSSRTASTSGSCCPASSRPRASPRPS
jgi:hypothetical protein